MSRIIRGIALVCIGLYGLLQLILGISMLGRSAWIAILFFLAGAVVLSGVVTRRSWLIATGLLTTLVPPLCVGLTGVEPFEVIHHVTRLALIAVLFGLWMLANRFGRSAVKQA